MINGKNYLIIFILIAFVFSCKKEDDEIIPFIPPVSTMSVDFSFLTTKKSSRIELSNWEYSTVSLAVWNSIINESCALPVISFEKTVAQKAVARNSSEWEWINKFDADTVTIQSRLTARIINDSVDWKLYISTIKQNIASPQYLWIEGKSAYDQTGGWWLIYEKPSNPNPFVRITWAEKGGETNNRFDFVKPNDERSGQYLEYGTRGQSFFNSYYYIKIHNENSIFIELNRQSREGRIKSDFIFNDEIWHCWDASLSNGNCN